MASGSDCITLSTVSHESGYGVRIWATDSKRTVVVDLSMLEAKGLVGQLNVILENVKKLRDVVRDTGDAGLDRLDNPNSS